MLDFNIGDLLWERAPNSPKKGRLVGLFRWKASAQLRRWGRIGKAGLMNELKATANWKIRRPG